MTKAPETEITDSKFESEDLKPDAMQVAEDNLDPDLPVFSVDILPVIKEAQNQHGLRHGDYQRYHGYCNRRLKRIRKVLKFKMGDKRKVTPKKVTEPVFTDPRYILMLLMTSERAWSLAMYLKQEANSEPRKRHHMVEKMRKAVVLASELNTLCESSEKVDARTKLEAQAYSAYMSGILQFELKDWVAAMDLFRKTQTIYGKLADTMSKEEQTVYKTMVDEISPNIRYCAYTIGDQSAMDDLMQMHGTGRQDPLLSEKLDFLIAESREKKAESMSEIIWRNRTIRVKNNKVRLFLIGVKEFEKDLSTIDDNDRDARVEVYDRLLTECKDALQVTRDDIRTDPHSKASEKTNKVSDLQFLQSYLTYLRLTKTIQRNLLLLQDLQAKSPSMLLSSGASDEAAAGDSTRRGPKPSDFIRLYDGILQNLSEILSLPGVDVDSEMSDAVGSQRTAFQAFRCFYVAQAYVNEKKWTEAMALYDRVMEHANKAMGAMVKQSQDDFVEFKVLNSSKLESLVETIAFNRYRVHASAILDSVAVKKDGESKEVDTTVPLMDRVDHYYEDPTISALQSGKTNPKVPQMTSAYPPSFDPVPCKPLFFDLALNHVTFPSLDKKLGKKENPQKAGITGLISNWWGWGGKK
ncbi:signal recognition particle subunit SRP68-like isoform X2 [Ciona intestinalis]